MCVNELLFASHDISNLAYSISSALLGFQDLALFIDLWGNA